MEKKVTRKQWREVAFLILFEKAFMEKTIEEIIADAQDSFNDEDDILNLIANPNEFVLRVVNGVYNNLEAIDKAIEANLINWRMNRISKVSICLMRMAIYEMMFEKDIPAGVSINEAVEFAKTYAGQEEASFINGVLGAAAKTYRKDEAEKK